jgi:hypothetical protein
MTANAEQLVAAARADDWQAVEQLARHWLAQRKFFLPHLFLVQTLLRSGRYGEADAEFDDLISYKHNLGDHVAGFPAVQRRYRDRLQRQAAAADGNSEGERPLPTRAAVLTAATALLDAAVPPQALADPGRAAICTFGSCFAANLARIMTAQGIAATSLLIEESVNSTYANRVLLELVCGDPAVSEGGAHADMHRAYGAEFLSAVREKIAAASHIVLTVGVAPCFFSTADGTFVFATNYRELLSAGRIAMRTTSHAENLTNLRAIIALMDRIAPAARKIITVSPVPLAATVELTSVVVADCVSKSTLHAAVQDMVAEDQRLTYFPAFEIVRGLAPYSAVELYGAEDRNTRHVSDWLVSFIVSSFLQRFFAMPDAA